MTKFRAKKIKQTDFEFAENIKAPLAWSILVLPKPVLVYPSKSKTITILIKLRGCAVGIQLHNNKQEIAESMMQTQLSRPFGFSHKAALK